MADGAGSDGEGEKKPPLEGEVVADDAQLKQLQMQVLMLVVGVAKELGTGPGVQSLLDAKAKRIAGSTELEKMRAEHSHIERMDAQKRAWEHSALQTRLGGRLINILSVLLAVGLGVMVFAMERGLLSERGAANIGFVLTGVFGALSIKLGQRQPPPQQ